MRVRRKVFWAIGIVLALIAAFIAVVLLWPTAPFRFLEGKTTYVTPHVVPDNMMGGPPGFMSTWVFKGDWKAFTAEAEAELRAKGWTKDNEASGFDTMSVPGGAEALYYRKGKDTVSFHRDAEPPFLETSDIVAVGRQRKGYVGVGLYQSDYEPGAMGELQRWLKGLLGL